MSSLKAKLLDLLSPERVIKFAGNWVELPKDLELRSANSFLVSAAAGEITILVGHQPVMYDRVRAIALLGLSPVKAVELRDLFIRLVQQYEATYGPITPDSGNETVH
tara:strand:+ start:155805 stop:156125 length:321 start_codon:yes stop_codon:yes gene_type:complete